MKIAVLGAGNIGGTIGLKWSQAGHEVRFGVRDPGAAKYSSLTDSLPPTAQMDSMGAAIGFADLVLFAIPGGSVEETAAAFGDSMNGKILFDATNNMAQPVINNIAVLAAAMPGAQVFRAFNYLGWENFAQPQFGPEQADLFYCGPAGEAQGVVADLITTVGLRPVYVGDLNAGPILDNLTALWFALAIQQGQGRHLAFKMLGD